MFKFYSQNQIQLLPPSLEDEVSEDHLARFISLAVDQLDLKSIVQQYSDKGENAYHPAMLLKVLIYGYAIGLRSSRKLARSVQENVVFMWLSGRQKPDFRTINDFRKNKLSDIKMIFKQVLQICDELGMIRCGKVSLDGTKIEAHANRHKAVYRKQLKRQSDRIDQQIEEIFHEAEAIDQEEDALYGLDQDMQNTGRAIDKKVVAELAKKLNSRKKKMESKKCQLQERQERLKEKVKHLQKRNSYTMTDRDATVMMMKENHIAPGYNIQLASERQVIVAYGIYQKCTDYHLLRPMREEIKAMMGRYPAIMIQDAGYGTRENTKYLRNKRQEFVMPYMMLNKDRGKRNRGEYRMPKKPDIFWEDMKKQMWQTLETKQGKKLMKRRGHDIEPVIGDLKYNQGLRKFLLRGQRKVGIETGLASMTHNFKKIRNETEYWEQYLRRMIGVQILTTEFGT